MNLTEQEKKMFKMLHNSATGRQLADYLRRVSSHICDARTWSEGDTKESSTQAAKTIEKHIISHLSRQTDRKEVKTNQFT